jgi:hypothetical protein
LCGQASKQRRIKRFRVFPINPNADLGSTCRGELKNKEPVKCRPGSGWIPQWKWFLAMPRFFFNTHIGDELVSDPEGEELRDLDRAWEVARAMIRELLKTEGAERSLFSAILEVTDDEGEVVLEFPFAEAILDLSDEPVTKH